MGAREAEGGGARRMVDACDRLMVQTGGRLLTQAEGSVQRVALHIHIYALFLYKRIRDPPPSC